MKTFVISLEKGGPGALLNKLINEYNLDPIWKKGVNGKKVFGGKGATESVTVTKTEPESNEEFASPFREAICGQKGCVCEVKDVICQNTTSEEYRNSLKTIFNPFWYTIAPSSALGIACSHFQVWKDFLGKSPQKGKLAEKSSQKCECGFEGTQVEQSPESYALIFEDDVVFEESFSKEKITSLIEATPKDFDVLYLGCFDSPVFERIAGVLDLKNDSARVVNDHVKVPGVAFALHAYILSKKGAKKLIKSLDGHIHNHLDLCIQRLAKAGVVKVYSANVKLVHQMSTDAGSSVESSNVTSSTPHPKVLHNVLKDIYIDQHVTSDYLANVNFMQIGEVAFNLISVLFIIIGVLYIIFFNEFSLSWLTFFFILLSVPDIVEAYCHLTTQQSTRPTKPYADTLVNYIILLFSCLMTQVICL